jgi:hypothetical protein
MHRRAVLPGLVRVLSRLSPTGFGLWLDGKGDGSPGRASEASADLSIFPCASPRGSVLLAKENLHLVISANRDAAAVSLYVVVNWIYDTKDIPKSQSPFFQYPEDPGIRKNTLPMR